MTAMCGMAKNFWQLALARMGVGAGEAGAVPPAQSLIADYYPPKERAGALGFYMMSSMAGYIIGMVVGGWAAQYDGWRAAFIIVVLPGYLLQMETQFLLPKQAAPSDLAATHSKTQPGATETNTL